MESKGGLDWLHVSIVNANAMRLNYLCQTVYRIAKIQTPPAIDQSRLTRPTLTNKYIQ